MASEDHDSISALWSKVEGIEGTISELGTRLSEEIRGVGDTFRRQAEALERRLNDQNTKTDSRFENLATSAASTAATRTSNAWQLLVGLGALGVSLWTLTKTPIDANFARLDTNITAILQTIREDNKEFRQAMKEQAADVKATYVPVGQVLNDEAIVRVNGTKIDKLMVDVAGMQTKVDAMSGAIDDIHDDEKSFATVPQYQQLDSRVTVISTRLQTIFESNYLRSFPPPRTGVKGDAGASSGE